MPLMKQGATLAYSHGFNIVEEGMQVRPDLTVIMVAPKCPGTEVREEYKRGFGVPTLIAVHPENDPQGLGLAQAKADGRSKSLFTQLGSQSTQHQSVCIFIDFIQDFVFRPLSSSRISKPTKLSPRLFREINR